MMLDQQMHRHFGSIDFVLEATETLHTYHIKTFDDTPLTRWTGCHRTGLSGWLPRMEVLASNEQTESLTDFTSKSRLVWT